MGAPEMTEALSHNEAIARILQIMQQQGITLEQLKQASAEVSQAKPKRTMGDIATKVFTYLGSIFVLGGIGAYIAMFWPSMSSFMRIFITLGVGIGFSIFSMIAMKEGKYPRIVLPLIVLAALIETTGWFVSIDELFPHGGDSRKAACFVFGIMALQQAITFGLFKRTSLLFFGAVFGYGFLAVALDLLGMNEHCIGIVLGASLICVSDWTSKTPHRILAGLGYFCAAIWFNEGLYYYAEKFLNSRAATAIIGLSLCSLAYGLKQSGWSKLSMFWFFVGSATFYCGLFDMVQHTPYELLYLVVGISMMYGHILLGSVAILITSTLAILGFIAYYTEEHFVHSIGWPIALILLGVMFLGIGAFAVRLHKNTKH
jgi:hypothetical protein